MAYPIRNDVPETRELLSGIISHVSGDGLLVQTPAGLVRAVRAAGCLLAPEQGDRVLVALLGAEAWVLNVLQRAKDTTATLRLPARTSISSTSLHISASNTQLSGENLQLNATSLAMNGTTLVVKFGLIRTLARRVDEFVRERCAHFGSLRERILGLAERRAGRVRLNSDTSLRVRAEHADLKAKTILDLDAEHIKLG